MNHESAIILPKNTGNMSNASIEIHFQIYGDDMQTVEVKLDSGETVVAEAGAMNWMEEGISFEARMGDGSALESGFFGSLLGAGKRIMTGESLFMTHFTNDSMSMRRVAFASPYPGKIMPVQLGDLGGEVICQKDAFLCAVRGTQVSIALNKRLGAGFLGGEGFILQRLRGNGLAFLHVGGTIVQKELNNDSLRIDTGCIVAYAGQIDYSVEMVGGMKSMFFGGEGLFLATLRGSGTVWLQSLPFSRLANRILANASAAGGKTKGERSSFGKLGRIMDGDFRI